MQQLKVNISDGHWTTKLGSQTAGCHKSFQSLVFVLHTTALWPLEQSSILSAKHDCPVAHQNLLFLATAHDCENGLWAGITQTELGCIILGLFRNRNGWNDQNNPSFLGLSWLQTCQNQLTVSLWRFYSHSGIRVAREWTIVWLIPTIPIPE